MDIVVQDDDPHHDPQAEGHGLLTGETTTILPGQGRGRSQAQGRSQSRGRSQAQGQSTHVIN